MIIYITLFAVCTQTSAWEFYKKNYRPISFFFRLDTSNDAVCEDLHVLIFIWTLPYLFFVSVKQWYPCCVHWQLFWTLGCCTACFSVFASNSATVDIRNCVDCITITRMCRGVNVSNNHAMCTFFVLLILIKSLFFQIIFFIVFV